MAKATETLWWGDWGGPDQGSDIITIIIIVPVELTVFVALSINLIFNFFGTLQLANMDAYVAQLNETRERLKEVERMGTLKEEVSYQIH